MERLTTRDIVDGSPILLRDKGYAELLDRLAAYEDTGLEPVEIHSMRKELEDCKEWMSFSMNDIKQKFFDFMRVMRQEAELDKKPKRRGRTPKEGTRNA